LGCYIKHQEASVPEFHLLLMIRELLFLLDILNKITYEYSIVRKMIIYIYIM